MTIEAMMRMQQVGWRLSDDERVAGNNGKAARMKLGWVLEQLWEWNRKDGGEVMMRESPEMMGKQQK